MALPPTLSTIQTKVRRLTRTPSTNQLSDADLNDYINTFILYNLPSELRLFPSRTTFTFYTEPYVDTYETNTSNPDNPLYNFQNRYITTHEPIYIGGYLCYMSQSREQFYRIYPLVNTIASIGLEGDGATSAFSGTLANIPVLQRNVLFDSIDANNNGLAVKDVPVAGTTDQGTLFDAYDETINRGVINYVSGAYSFTFAAPPASGQAINSQTVPYVPSIPTAMCYFDNKFILRPVPDQPYRVDMEVYIRPTALIEEGSAPQIEQWWQYIAYGAAKLIFEDRMDLESVQQIMPEYNKQMRFVLRTTLVQMAKERSATIYSEQTCLGANGNGFYWGGGNF